MCLALRFWLVKLILHFFHWTPFSKLFKSHLVILYLNATLDPANSLRLKTPSVIIHSAPHYVLASRRKSHLSYHGAPKTAWYLRQG